MKIIQHRGGLHKKFTSTPRAHCGRVALLTRENSLKLCVCRRYGGVVSNYRTVHCPGPYRTTANLKQFSATFGLRAEISLVCKLM